MSNDCLPESTGIGAVTKTTDVQYQMGLLVYTGTKVITAADDKVTTTEFFDDTGALLVPGTFQEISGVLPVPANVGGTAGGAGGDASNLKLDELLAELVLLVANQNDPSLQAQTGITQVAQANDSTFDYPDTKSYLVRNVGTTTIHVAIDGSAVGISVFPGESWFAEADTHTVLSPITVIVDPAPLIGTVNLYEVQTWHLLAPAP